MVPVHGVPLVGSDDGSIDCQSKSASGTSSKRNSGV